MSAAPTPIGPIHALPALVETDARLLELLGTLSPADWDQPTIVPRWRVRHIAGHLLDTALRRLTIVRDGVALERPASGSAADVRTFVDRLNAEGVTVYGRLSATVLATLMRAAVAELHLHLHSLDPDGPAMFAVSWAGDEHSANWFDIARELTERWHHQQQIRLALDRPGLLEPPLYHPVLDTFLRVLPHAYRAVPAPPGAQVDVVVPGASGGVWRLYRTAERWRLAADAVGASAARVTIPADIAWRVFTKGIARADAAARDGIEGDHALGWPVLDAVAIVG
jgi:uncharacterized protein (TIGR03083 family)